MNLASIIIPTFNRPQFTERAIQSALAQSYKNTEIIVVDDGSNQQNKLQLEILSNKLAFTLLYQVNTGVSSARNLAAQHAKGKYFAFLDSDDLWAPTKLEKQIHFLTTNSQYKIVHCEEAWIRNNQPVPVHKKYKKQGGNLFSASLKNCVIGCSTVVIEADLFSKFKGFDENFVVCEDYDLWLQICREHEVGLIDEALTQKHAGHACQLSKKKELDYWRVKALEKLLTQPLTPEQKKLTLEQMQFRLQILIKGYEKYQKTEKLTWAKDKLIIVSQLAKLV